jgi:hypothetical protein
MWAAINRRPVLAGAKGYSLRSNQRGYGLDDVRVEGVQAFAVGEHGIMRSVSLISDRRGFSQ